MQLLLAKHRPTDLNDIEFDQFWRNAHYTLQPLADAIVELITDRERIKREDFGLANHYEKLVYEGGEVAMARRILDLFPVSVNK